MGLLHMRQQCDVENKVKYSRNYLINYAATEVDFNGVMCVTRRNGSNKCPTAFITAIPASRCVAAAVVHKGYCHPRL